VDNVEKVGDHLANIAQAIIGGLHWDGIELKKIAPEQEAGDARQPAWEADPLQ
jgi:hypothetical protein